MKSYCYSAERAQKKHYDVSFMKIFLLFLIPILCCCISGYLALKFNVALIIIIVFLLSIIYIAIGVTNIVRYGKSKMLSIVNYENALYLLINNNKNDASWISAANKYIKKSIVGGIASTAISVSMLSDTKKKYEFLSYLMNNEEFIKTILNDPRNKLAKGIEIHKIININSYIENNKGITLTFDGLEMSNCIMFKNKKVNLLNVYNNFEELVSLVKEYKKINEETIKINSKKTNEYNKLFNKNNKIYNIFTYVYLIITLLNLINLFAVNLNQSIILFAQTIIFCIILAYYEPTKNTNINGKDINKNLKYSLIMLVINIVIYVIKMFLVN